MKKEFIQLKQAIRNWLKANKNNVSFIGSFVSFDPKKKDEDDAILDDIIIGYGDKKGIKLLLDELSGMLDQDGKDFINW